MTEATTHRPPPDDGAEREFVAFSRSEADAPLHALLARARRSVAVYAPRLDLAVLNSRDGIETLAGFVALSRRNRARFLIGDEQWFLRNNPRLVALARRFSSCIEVRRPPDEMPAPDTCFLVVDASALFQQPKLDEPRCLLITGDKQAAARMLSRFENEWKMAVPLAELFTAGL